VGFAGAPWKNHRIRRRFFGDFNVDSCLPKMIHCNYQAEMPDEKLIIDNGVDGEK
jgi:hypothetical protein